MATIEDRIKKLQAQAAKKVALETAKKTLEKAKADLKKLRGK